MSYEIKIPTEIIASLAEEAEALFAYYDIGVTTFLIRGFAPLEDAIDYGQELIPLGRQEIARREANSANQLRAAG